MLSYIPLVAKQREHKVILLLYMKIFHVSLAFVVDKSSVAFRNCQLYIISYSMYYK